MVVFAAGVLRPVEEDLAAAPRLGHRARSPASGCSAWSSSATSLASAVDSSDGSRFGERGVQVQALAAAGDRRRGRGRAPPSLSRTSSATWQHSCRPAGSPGSRSITSRSGLRGRPLRADGPLVHVQLERGQVDQPGQRGEVVDDREGRASPSCRTGRGSRWSGPSPCAPTTGSRRARSSRRSSRPATAVRPADPGHARGPRGAAAAPGRPGRSS